MKNVSMQKIADYLHVSKSIVSLALNDKYGVSSDMRFKVYNAAIELGYDFNYNYKDKNNKRRNRIVVYVKNDSFKDNEYWTSLLKGSEKILGEENYKFILNVWNKDDKEEKFLEGILDGTIQGALIIDDLPEKIIDILKNMNIPIIIVDGKKYQDREFDNVRTNNYLGGFLAAEYLDKMGHKKVAFVGDKEFSISFRERYYGFKNYIDEHPYMEYIGFAGYSFNMESYKEEEQSLINLLKKKNRPTALFCANDMIAAYVYDVLKTLDLKPYEDISIIGFDNILDTENMNPPLTSVSVKIDELGKTAVEQLLDRIKYKDSPKKSILLSVELSIKESVRKI